MLATADAKDVYSIDWSQDEYLGYNSVVISGYNARRIRCKLRLAMVIHYQPEVA